MAELSERADHGHLCRKGKGYTLKVILQGGRLSLAANLLPNFTLYHADKLALVISTGKGRGAIVVVSPSLFRHILYLPGSLRWETEYARHGRGATVEATRAARSGQPSQQLSGPILAG